MGLFDTCNKVCHWLCQINGAVISAGAANISVNARARTTPARVCSAPPRSAALGWSLHLPKYYM